MTLPSPLVSTVWLNDHLQDANVGVVDASWFMPNAGRDPRKEFAAAHIPGAQFFDIEELSDHATELPHMMPAPATFAAGIEALGIGNDDFVVVYDASGIYSAPRAWWMLRAMGHDKVAVLDGGLPKWRQEGRPVEQGARPPTRADFHARPAAGLVRDFNAVQGVLAAGNEQVLDARSGPRFRGDEPEPRPHLRGGHMPGASNVYYADLIAADGTLKPRDALQRIFAERGVDLGKPAIASCGSGITAAIVLLALEIAGAKRISLYDGSWAEWGARGDAPVVKGAA